MKRLWLVLLLLAGCAREPRLPSHLEADPPRPEAVAELAGQLFANLTTGQSLVSGDARAERILLLSLSDGRQSKRYQARAESLYAAAQTLAEQARSDGLRPLWLRLDVVADLADIPDEPPALERGLAGLAADGSPPRFWLPLEVPTSVLSNDGELNLERLKKLDPDCERWLNFGTVAAFSDAQGSFPLYRGHALEAPARGPDELLEAARRGGDYLLRGLSPEGRFAYCYHPTRDRFSTDYNMLRHAGAVYALLELYQETRQPEYLEGARRGLEFMMYSVEESRKFNSTRVLVDDGSVKLGGNALAILALARYVDVTGERRWLAEMEDLAEWMVRNQSPDGRFRVHKENYPAGEDSGFRSEYYPGEALVALVNLHRLDPDERWLKAARRAARYQIRRARREKRPPHDHWLMIGLEQLYRIDPDPSYRDYAFDLSEMIMTSQKTAQARPDWDGGFYTPPRSTPTDIRLEGLNAAWALAVQAGDGKRIERLRSSVERGLAFSSLCEVTPERAALLVRPDYCRGGVMRGLADPEIRIDYVQHHISALLGAYRLTKPAPAKP
ncbi:MAG: hypothetical protein AB7S38_33050 [Vulcanimicrobiota bacterium]